MGLLRIMTPHKIQLLAVLAFGVSMLFIENQIQKLEESRAKLGETRREVVVNFPSMITELCSCKVLFQSCK